MGSLEDSKAVKVGAVFKGSRIEPKWFIWENRKYEVREVNYTWSDHLGREKLHCFSVTDGTNNYELSFHADQAVWRLNKVFNA